MKRLSRLGLREELRVSDPEKIAGYRCRMAV